MERFPSIRASTQPLMQKGGGEARGCTVGPVLGVHLWKPFLGILGSHLVAISVY